MSAFSVLSLRFMDHCAATFSKKLSVQEEARKRKAAEAKLQEEAAKRAAAESKLSAAEMKKGDAEARAKEAELRRAEAEKQLKAEQVRQGGNARGTFGGAVTGGADLLITGDCEGNTLITVVDWTLLASNPGYNQWGFGPLPVCAIFNGLSSGSIC